MIHDADNRGRTLFQPLVAALLCLLLILLFLVTALMDIRRTQNTLMEVFENKGDMIIEAVEMMARDKLDGLMGITNRASVSFRDLNSIEDGFRVQEAILTLLIELAREVDRRGKGGRLAKKELEALALEAGLRAIVLCDGRGKVIIESAPVSKILAPRLKLLMEGNGEVALDFAGEERGGNFLSLVGLRRENKAGMIVLVFDREGLEYWASRVVIQEAVQEGGWRKGVQYFMVVDPRGRFLAGAGDLTEAASGEGLQSNVKQIRAKDGRSGRRIVQGSPELLEVYRPLQLNGRRAGVARIGMEIETARRLRERNEAHILFSTALMMIGAVLGTLIFYRIQTRHQGKIQEMGERLHQAERLSSLGRLAAGLAHEIRNPLNSIGMAIQRIHREFPPPEPEDMKEFSGIVNVIRMEIRRLNRLIEDFVGPARMRRAEFRTERLSDLLDRVVRLAREEAGAGDIRIECQWEDPDLMVRLDPARMHQAVFNLIKNAMESMTGPGSITVSARPQGPHHAVITIMDTGVGIPAEAMKRILDFEYTTKEKGLGLGLPIAREIIQAHGGELRIESEPGKGTTIEVVLPRRER